MAQRHHAGFVITSHSSSRGFFSAIERDGDYGSSAVLKVA
jgi:hypothetical protein